MRGRLVRLEKSIRWTVVCFDDVVFDATYARASDVLWRSAPDRMLVRRVGHEGLDLFGLAAMVWLALDTPRTITELEREIESLFDESVHVGETVEALVAVDLVEQSDDLLAASEDDG